MAYIIAVVSEGDGTGKTTICHFLGGALANSGHQVLLVDYTWKFDLSALMTADDAACRTNAKCMITEQMIKQCAGKIHQSRYKRLFWILGSPELDHAWNLLSSGGLGMAEIRNRTFGQLDHSFQFVLIDCPSGFVFHTQLSLAIADFALVPTKFGPSGIQNLRKMMKSIRNHQERINRRLGDPWVVLNCDRSGFRNPSKFEMKARDEFYDNMLITTVPWRKVYRRPARTNDKGKLILDDRRPADPTTSMDNLAGEISESIRRKAMHGPKRAIAVVPSVSHLEESYRLEPFL